MSFRPRFGARVALALATLGTLTACDSLTSSGDVRLTVLLTDAPSDYIGEAMVDIGRVELLPADDGDRIVLSEDGTDGPIDLLELQGLTTSVLADLEIPAGTYRELRMFVEDASVVLADGYEFDDGSTESSLRVPSGASSGLKLKLRDDGDVTEDEESDENDSEGEEVAEGVEISGGETALVVDFDVNQSFVIQGNPSTPAGIKGVLFRPTLRVVVRDVAGSISGAVSTAVAEAGIEGLVVSAERVAQEGDEEFQSSTATALTDAAGAYTIHFVAPGTYRVTVATGVDGLTTNPTEIEVTVGESEAVTEVDFEVVAG